MPQPPRLTRRLLGVIAKRIPDLQLRRVADPRKARGKRWKLNSLLHALLAGMICGCKGLAEVEDLTEDMSLAARRLLRIDRRVPDTTTRDLLCKLDPEQLRASLGQLVRKAWRRKALVPVGLPFGAVSMDGKVISTKYWDAARRIAQVREDGAYALVRTVTSCLISSAARICMDMHVIAGDANESSTFPAAFGRLVADHGGMFRVVLYDSGANSRANARLIIKAGKDYVLRVQDEQPTIFDECKRRLGRKRASTSVRTVDPDGGKVVTRRVWVDARITGWHDFPGLRTAIRVQSETEDIATGEISFEDRYFISSLAADELAPATWLTLIRRHWSVENACHGTWDKIFREDDRQWVRHPAGMLNVMLIRRIAYNLLTLFRCVTQRGYRERAIPWKRLMGRFHNAMLLATDEMIDGLRLLSGARATI